MLKNSVGRRETTTRAEAQINFQRLIAALKGRSSTAAPTNPGFSSNCKAAFDFAALTARLETAPFQSWVVNRVFQQPARG
jgi:hypothetical protein